MASQGAKRLAEERASVEYLVEQFPEEFFGEGWDDEQEEKRRRLATPDYSKSVWGKMLLDPALDDPTSIVAITFRRRFRVPYPLFKEVLIPRCKEKKIFPAGKGCSIPVEMKLLVALRILGRDAVADDCNELSSIGLSTCHDIFKRFVKLFSSAFYEDYVFIPRGSHLLDVMEVYRRLGFPGCIGSIDCTHVKWSACARDLKWKATGKEGFTTLSFQAIASHDWRCQHISIGFLGSYKDITVSKNDEVVQKLMAGSMKDVEYVMYDAQGIPTLCKGAYLLADNGYKSRVSLCVHGRLLPQGES